MSIYDLLMLAVLAGSILFGLWKGLAWQVASLASIFVSYFIALNFRGPLSTWITASEPWNRFAAMLILFLSTSLIIWIGYGFLKNTIQRLRLRGFDAQAGALLGAVKGVLLCMLITLFGVTLFGENTRSAVIASRSGGYIAAGINRLNALIPAEIHQILDPHIQHFNEELANDDPQFLSNSQNQLDQRLQTFRGKFQLPARGENFSGPMGTGIQANSNSDFNSGNGGRGIGDRFLDAGQKILNEGFTAGKQRDDRSNR